jgi:hypothetical protein
LTRHFRADTASWLPLRADYDLTTLATRRGLTDQAFALLERAIDERAPSALEILLDLSFDVLHGDPRWPVLLARKPFAGMPAAAKL